MLLWSVVMYLMNSEELPFWLVFCLIWIRIVLEFCNCTVIVLPSVLCYRTDVVLSIVKLAGDSYSYRPLQVRWSKISTCSYSRLYFLNELTDLR